MALRAILEFTAYCPKIHVLFVIFYRICGLKKMDNYINRLFH